MSSERGLNLDGCRTGGSMKQKWIYWPRMVWLLHRTFELKILHNLLSLSQTELLLPLEHQMRHIKLRARELKIRTEWGIKINFHRILRISFLYLKVPTLLISYV